MGSTRLAALGTWVVATAVIVVFSTGLSRLAADESLSKAEADSMSQKIQAIIAYGEAPRRPARQTLVSEREVNAYLRFGVANALPAGVIDPSVSILGAGRVSGKATVDFDVAKRRRQSSAGWFDPLALVSGQVPVAAVGTLQAQQGMARFELESAEVAGVKVPKLLLQELLNLYARSPEFPDGISLDDPFPLPANIQEIRVGEQRAVIVQ